MSKCQLYLFRLQSEIKVTIVMKHVRSPALLGKLTLTTMSNSLPLLSYSNTYIYSNFHLHLISVKQRLLNSTQLRLKFILPVNVKMPTFISRINYRLWRSKPEISIYLVYELLISCSAELSM